MAYTPLERLIGSSAAMREVRKMIESLAPTDTTALLYGETGTGKELVAEALHALSPRLSAPLIRVNCAAFPEQLLESELFGHVRGAFTGAINERIGCFEAAEAGTLFLDEIGDISASTQVRLLRVLEEKSFQKLGCCKTRPMNVRIITATNKNLAAEVATGRFRDDLFYRLNTVIITLPPLRELREDIPELAKYFVQFFNHTFTRKISAISDEALAELTARPWPGNVRELRNVIEHAFVYCKGTVIEVNDLGPNVADLLLCCEESPKDGSGFSAAASIPLNQNNDLDADTICHVLEQHHWHIGRTAAALNMHRTTLWRHMQRLGLSNRN